MDPSGTPATIAQRFDSAWRLPIHSGRYCEGSPADCENFVELSLLCPSEIRFFFRGKKVQLVCKLRFRKRKAEFDFGEKSLAYPDHELDLSPAFPVPDVLDDKLEPAEERHAHNLHIV